MPHLVPVVFALLALAADPPPPTPTPSPSPADLIAALETALADAIAKAEPSVVAIARFKDGKGEATIAVRGMSPARPDPDQPFALQLGGHRGLEGIIPDYYASDFASGVVIGDHNEILTTAHAIKGASLLIVRAAGGQEFWAEVIASDPRSDLAVIAPREGPDQRKPSLRPVKIGAPGIPRNGTSPLALGNPSNAGRAGQASASWGILANTSRRLNPTPSKPPQQTQLRHYPTLYQL